MRGRNEPSDVCSTVFDARCSTSNTHLGQLLALEVLEAPVEQKVLAGCESGPGSEDPSDAKGAGLCSEGADLERHRTRSSGGTQLPQALSTVASWLNSAELHPGQHLHGEQTPLASIAARRMGCQRAYLGAHR